MKSVFSSFDLDSEKPTKSKYQISDSKKVEIAAYAIRHRNRHILLGELAEEFCLSLAQVDSVCEELCREFVFRASSSDELRRAGLNSESRAYVLCFTGKMTMI